MFHVNGDRDNDILSLQIEIKGWIYGCIVYGTLDSFAKFRSDSWIPGFLDSFSLD